jgi:hypothetical protein
MLTFRQAWLGQKAADRLSAQVHRAHELVPEVVGSNPAATVLAARDRADRTVALEVWDRCYLS